MEGVDIETDWERLSVKSTKFKTVGNNKGLLLSIRILNNIPRRLYIYKA